MQEMGKAKEGAKEKEFERNNETPTYVILLAIFGISVPLLVLVGKQ